MNVLKPLRWLAVTLEAGPALRRTLLGLGLVALVLGSSFDAAFEAVLSGPWTSYDRSDDR